MKRVVIQVVVWLTDLFPKPLISPKTRIISWFHGGIERDPLGF